jgi:hypothetical protein
MGERQYMKHLMGGELSVLPTASVVSAQLVAGGVQDHKT